MEIAELLLKFGPPLINMTRELIKNLGTLKSLDDKNEEQIHQLLIDLQDVNRQLAMVVKEKLIEASKK